MSKIRIKDTILDYKTIMYVAKSDKNILEIAFQNTPNIYIHFNNEDELHNALDKLEEVLTAIELKVN